MIKGNLGGLKLACTAFASRSSLARHIGQSACCLDVKGDSSSEGRDVVSPAPGTVTEYAHHVFIRSPPQATDEQGLGAWWPAVVERLPAFQQAFTAVAAARRSIEGVVKVTAYEYASEATSPPLPPDKCDMMVFPEGVWLRGLPQQKIGSVIRSLVAEPTEADPDFTPPPLDKKIARLAQPVPPFNIFVCCHGSRDARCGLIGPRLVRLLQELVQARGWQDSIAVFRCSHIGGHKYAGNVLVYSAVSPCDGDWFGGISTANTEAFLDALADADVGGSGGVSEERLRPFWRGRMGLTKQEQLQAYNDRRLFLEEGDKEGDDGDLEDMEADGNDPADNDEWESDYTASDSEDNSSFEDELTSSSSSSDDDDLDRDSGPPLRPAPDQR